MKRKLVPIKTIIKEVENLSTDIKKNKKKLIKYSNLAKSQKTVMSNISVDKIKDKLNTKLTYEEYCKYKDLLKEKKRYNKYSSTIDKIIERQFMAIKLNKKLKRARVTTGLVAGALVAALGSVGYISLNKNLNRKNQEEITSKTTIETTTEPTTEVAEVTTTENTTEITTEATTESTTKATTEATTMTTTEVTTEDKTFSTTENTTETIEFDDGVIDYSKFGKLKDFYFVASGYIDKMESTITNEDERNEAKENAKSKVIEYIDFIFYGKQINGVTFDELKDDEKQKVYEQLQDLNRKIEEKDPDYLENMGERYGRLKDLGSLTLEKAKEKIKEKVGEDYYDDADQVKKDTVETIKETGGLLKKYIKEKYEEWRDN